MQNTENTEEPDTTYLERFNAYINTFSQGYFRFVNFAVTGGVIAMTVMAKVQWEDDLSLHAYIRAWVRTLLPGFVSLIILNFVTLVPGQFWRVFTGSAKQRPAYEKWMHKVWLCSYVGLFFTSWLTTAIGHDSWSKF